MRLKIFLRGLGAGIVFSALIMLVCTSSLSEEFIIEKAKEYGMVMKDEKTSNSSKTEEDIDKLKDELNTNKPDKEDNPSDSNNPVESINPSKEPDKTSQPEDTKGPVKTVQPSKAPQPTKTVQPSKEPQPTKTVQPSKEPQPTKTVQPSKEPQPTKTVQPTKEPVDGSKITFTISRGMNSYSAAKVLEQKGIIKSARDFDSYLCKNKLDSRVKAGTFTATKGMSYAQLAKIITRK